MRRKRRKIKSAQLFISYASSSTLYPCDWVSEWAEFRTTEASRLASLLVTDEDSLEERVNSRIWMHDVHLWGAATLPGGGSGWHLCTMHLCTMGYFLVTDGQTNKLILGVGFGCMTSNHGKSGNSSGWFFSVTDGRTDKQANSRSWIRRYPPKKKKKKKQLLIVCCRLFQNETDDKYETGPSYGCPVYWKL